jgi:hypothetical protein
MLKGIMSFILLRVLFILFGALKIMEGCLCVLSIGFININLSSYLVAFVVFGRSIGR